ncbi:MAG: phosphonate C-P lyase system protein PhnH, partial [Paracoccus sp. (in: a-proteobacteria)]
MSPLTAGLADPATDSARGFRILMQAMARPGTIHRLHLVDPPSPLGAAAASV